MQEHYCFLEFDWFILILQFSFSFSFSFSNSHSPIHSDSFYILQQVEKLKSKRNKKMIQDKVSAEVQTRHRFYALHFGCLLWSSSTMECRYRFAKIKISATLCLSWKSLYPASELQFARRVYTTWHKIAFVQLRFLSFCASNCRCSSGFLRRVRVHVCRQKWPAYDVSRRSIPYISVLGRSTKVAIIQYVL